MFNVFMSSLDSHRNEIDRLKLANKDLENDRNQIRQSLKQMLELQMKEALQLLGINKSSIQNDLENINQITAKKTHEKIEEVDTLTAMKKYEDSINKIFKHVNMKPASPAKSLESIKPEVPKKPENQEIIKDPFSNYEESINQIFNQVKTKHDSPIKPIDTAKTEDSVKVKDALINYEDSINQFIKQVNIKPESQNEPVEINSNDSIKDTYILNQIDLINQFYKIDNKQISNTEDLVDSEKKKNFDKSLSSSTSTSNSSSFFSETNINVNSISVENKIGKEHFLKSDSVFPIASPQIANHTSFDSYRRKDSKYIRIVLVKQ